MFDPFTILAALLPTLQYGATKIIDKYTGGPSPSSAEEALKLKQADVAQLEALAKLDNADGASRWVTNVRAMMRPLAVTAVLGMWSFYAFKMGITAMDMQNMASAVMFYLFGDRLTMTLIGRKK